tara:strand:- start:1873 stop:2508 length:636 start_codon:yes stop_codon:yes gene_type:complete
LTFDIDWWWKYQKDIETQFSFSKVREQLAVNLSLRYFKSNNHLGQLLYQKEAVIVGAGITDQEAVPVGTVIAADGAVKACLQRDIVPDFVVTDMDGYISDLKYAFDNGCKVIIHIHGDNLSRFPDYSSVIEPVCITSAYPSSSTSCWGGFTDGDRALMMSLSLGCKSVRLVGFDFDKIGLYSGNFSPKKLEKLEWARKIIEECSKRSNKIQ